MYAIFNKSKGCYVARLGSKLSFTKSWSRVRVYQTYDAAKADCCNNETVVAIPYYAR